SKAERYARLRDEMRGKLTVVLASKFTELDRESAEIDAQINRISEELQQQTDAVQQLESEHGERTQRSYAVSTETEQNRERLKQTTIEMDRAHARRRTNEERGAELVVRSGASEAELAQVRHRLTALESELDSNRQILDSATADLASAQNDLAMAQQEA